MKVFISFILIILFNLSFAQLTNATPTDNLPNDTSEEFLLNPKNDWIMINPTKRIYRDNPTVYTENDFERTYKPYSTKNRIDSDSFLAQAGGLMLFKSTLFIFEKGLESLFQPKPKKNKHTKLNSTTVGTSKLRRAKGKGIKN